MFTNESFAVSTLSERLVAIAQAHGCHAHIMADGRVLIGSPATHWMKELKPGGIIVRCTVLDIVANWEELRAVLGY